MASKTIFEQIRDGEIPARIVHETETTLAFLDAHPLARGHTLVVPKEPYEHLQDLPADLSADLFETVHELTPVIEEAVDADASTIGINNGEAAGQEVPHVHIHIIPRFEGDDSGPIHAIAIDSPDLTEDELDEIAAAIDA
ncbi:HIT family protein [Halohasta litorea]|uniref:HIT family protein n=1 Tax=Halohasta litorea TaxID=869891 RepID=A0ABD6D3U5_9EURY|nr:HIT family protein [Halohasta litorea]